METGIMPQTNANPQYGDVSDIDYTQMQNQLATAKTLFEELPEQVKARFNNEMHTFLHFAENPDNLPERKRQRRPFRQASRIIPTRQKQLLLDTTVTTDTF
jgi:hypothetical protein